jgi:hypothetical protein
MINKKAQTFSIFYFMVIVVVAVIMLSGMVWIQGKVNSIMHQVGVENDIATNSGANSVFSFPCPDNVSRTCTGSTYVNMTQASDLTFGQVNSAIQALRMVAVVYILGLAVIIIVTFALMRMSRIWFFAYILISMLAIIFAPTISNAYLSLLQTGIMDNTLASFTTANWILLNLPIIVLIISILGGVLLFIGFLRQEDSITNLQ